MRWWVVLPLLMPLGVGPPAQADAASTFPVVLITDAEGDATPSSLAAPPLDVHRLLVVGEDPDGIDFRLEVGPFATYTTASVGSYGVGRIYVEFKVANITHEVSVYVGKQTNPECAAVFCLVESPYQGRYTFDVGSGAYGGPVHLDDAKDELTFRVPRRFLAGDAIGRWYGVNVTKGTEIREVRTVSVGVWGPFTGEYGEAAPADLAPDTGVGRSYALRFDPASTVLQAHIEDDLSPVPVDAGANRSVRLAVANLAPMRQTINLTYNLSTTDEAQGKILVYGPGSVSLPGGRWRNYTFHIATAPDLPDFSLGGLLVKAVSNVTRDVAYASTAIERGQRLNPETNTFFLHAAARRDGFVNECDAPHPLLRCRIETWLSPRKTEAGDEAGHQARVYYTPDSSPNPALFVDRRLLAEPVALRPGGTIAVKIAAVSEGEEIQGAEMRVEALVDVGRHRYETLASASQTVDLDADPKEIAFELPLKAGRDVVLPPPARFAVAVALVGDDSWRTGLYSFTSGASLLVDSFRAEYPIIELPAQYRAVETPSPFQISYEGEREEFVNPGRHHLFHLTVTNIDSAEQRLRTSSRVEGQGWTHEVRPGSEFFLPPGVGVTVGLVVGAPAGAGEGEHVNLTFEAAADDGTVRAERLVLTATTGADFADQRDAFVADPEDRGRLATRPVGSPAPAGLVMLMGIAGAAGGFAALRRRRVC